MGPVNSTFTMILGQLATAVPMLLVYVGGIVLAVLWRRRAPRAMTFAIAGLGLMFLVTVGMTVTSGYIISTRNASSIGFVLPALGLASAVLRALGMGLVVAGVFAERPPLRGGGFDVATAELPLAGLAPQVGRPAENTGAAVIAHE